MVMDKFTSAPRGFAFVHFFSVADATRALHAFQVFTYSLYHIFRNKIFTFSYFCVVITL